MPTLDQVIERITAYAEQRLEESGIPGLSLTLTDRVETLHTSAHGHSDFSRTVPIAPETLFEFGSASKSFVVVALMRLVEEGRLALGDPIQKHLPWFEVPNEGGPITIHHLLSHTAGLVVGNDIGPNCRHRIWAQRETAIPAHPGDRYHYSNLGFEALGYAMEKLTGEPLEHTVRRLVLDPLGMELTEAAVLDRHRLRMAVGHDVLHADRPRDYRLPLAPSPWHETRSACGCILANARELGIWLRFFLNRGKPLLSEASFARMITRNTMSTATDYYLYGLRDRLYDGHRIIGHSGGMVGHASDFGVDMESGIGAAVLVNAPGSSEWITTDITSYAYRLLRALQAGEELPPIPPRRRPTFVENATEFMGVYHCGERSLTLSEEQWQLILHHAGDRVVLERRGGGDVFFAGHPDFEMHLLEFERDGAKRVCAVHHGPDTYVNAHHRGPTEFSRPAAWDAYAGHYRAFTPWDRELRVFPRRDQLMAIAPRCFGGQQPLTPLGEEGLFRLRGEHNPEWVRFDTVIDGQAQRALLSGVEYLWVPAGG